MLLDGTSASSTSFHEDMIRISDRLPREEEYRRVRHLDLQKVHETISIKRLEDVLAACPHLETVVLAGVPHVRDRILAVLAENAINLLGLDIYGCRHITNAGVMELTNKSLPLQWIRLNGVVGLTDPSISAIAKTCSRLVELELCDLPLLTSAAVRDIWSFSRKLRTLRLANNPMLNDRAFPVAADKEDSGPSDEKPLPPRPMTWLEVLPPLILRHSADNLRVLDLTQCKITDDAVEGIVGHARRIQTFILSGCALLTDSALESICKLREHLDALMLAHVPNITDRGIIKLARSCTNLRCVDVSFCRNLTDMSVFELAGLTGLRRLSLVRVHRLTDIGLYALAEHAAWLERLHLSYCDRLSLEALHLLLRKLERLDYLTASGVSSLCTRKGVYRFSERLPANSSPDQQAAYCVFTGQNVSRLRQFLDKEENRRREAEAKNIPFIMRDDDKLDLY